MSIKRLNTIVFASAVALAAPGAAVAADQATAPIAAAQAVSLPSAASVAAIYDQYRMKPIWFRNGAPSVAATQLVQILRRSPLDGLGSGPQMPTRSKPPFAKRGPAMAPRSMRPSNCCRLHGCSTSRRSSVLRRA